ncbi:MAG: recombinase family protein [Oscillospiraceae bacterium]|nr:recombinase family protein [Oscillospiraceae bacterium]
MPRKNQLAPVRRAALYIRVSTEEQAMHGYSLDAQREALTHYARNHGMEISSIYIDDGVTARKSFRVRPQFNRMLQDVQADKLDIILFIKLDRWFRNVSDYYEVQKILDAHNVDWAATEEQYDTTTANGRLNLNIRLAIAQDESDRTSERIKFVFQNKIARKEAITGRFPPGFRIENKHLVLDPEKVGIIRELFQHYAEHGSKHGAVLYIHDTYGLSIDRHTFQKMLRNPLYKGEYRGVPDYCEPLIAPELFDRLQTAPTVRAAPTGRVYLFSGLVVCACCGQHMSARFNRNKTGSTNIYYRCNNYSNFKECENSKMVNEKNIEEWLLEHIGEEISGFLSEYEVQRIQRQKPQTDSAVIKRKLDRLKELYVNEIIDMETYKADYAVYTAQLTKLEQPEPSVSTADIEKLRELLRCDFKTAYASMDREAKRILWRGTLKAIYVAADKRISISFA